VARGSNDDDGDGHADGDDDHDDDSDDYDNDIDDTSLFCANSHGDKVPPCKPPSMASKSGETRQSRCSQHCTQHGGAKHRSDN